MWLHTAIITVDTARTNFPIDMLRYDTCYPADNDSVLHILPMHASDGVTRTRRIMVCKLTRSKDTTAAWTVARWQSFGVQCIPQPARRV